jgi:hypothetical protein
MSGLVRTQPRRQARPRDGAAQLRTFAGSNPHLLLVPVGLAAAATATVLGARRRFIDVDGISYLDVADAYLQGGWAAGANAYWSPLYPWLLAGAKVIFGTGREVELAIAQVVNASIFVVALACFIFFWGELDRFRARVSPGKPARAIFGTWLWWGMGYALFFWCAFRLITVWGTTPDLLVLGAVLAAGAVLVRMTDRPLTWHLPIGLGVILALGYLAKAVMFPLAFAFLLAAWGALGRDRHAAARSALALLAFAAVSAPFVVTLSMQKERFTFGDSGRLNYARFVNGVPDIHWQGEIPGNGTPIHPTRKLASQPAIYEFAGPVGGTYPVWYDPTYWYEGVEANLDARQQLSALVRTGYTYTQLLLLRQGAAAAAVLLLFVAMGRERRWGVPAVGRLWFLGFPALAGLGLYALVYAEGRYIAPFLVLGWGAVLAAVRLPADPVHRRLLTAGGAIVCLVFSLNLLMPNEKVLRTFLASPQPTGGGARYDVGPSGATAQLPAARALADLGIVPGDPVAFIGYSYYAYWARLAGVRIVAEVPAGEADRFWEADEAGRARIISTLFSAGPRAIVLVGHHRHPPPYGWDRLGETGYYTLLASDGARVLLQ